MITNRDDLARTPLREFSLDCVEAAIDSVHPTRVLERRVTMRDDTLLINGTEYNLTNYDDIIVIGGGNVAGHVAAALEDLLEDRITTGAVVTDNPVPTKWVDVIQGDYPVPNEDCLAGARQVLQIAKQADENDLVFTILSGGGSPLLSAPVAEISLADMQSLTRVLFSEGLEVEEINVVRKHLSAIKGGKLSTAIAPATVVGLVFSDVIGNAVDHVASGPTAPDKSTYEDALRILDQYDVDIPDRVRRHLEWGRGGHVEETPTTGDPVFDNVTHHVLADGMTALTTACDFAQEQGYRALLFSSRLRGNPREIAKAHVATAEECRVSSIPVEPPVAIIAGGQTTLSTPRESKIGPNQVYALSAAIQFQQRLREDVALASVATDGFDGFAEVSGAVVDEHTGQFQHQAWDALENDETYNYLSQCGDLIELESTGTSVNDIHVLVVE